MGGQVKGGLVMNEKSLMTQLTPEVLKQLQETQIEILDEIVRICKKNGLRYFLIYGTLIGAIRHKGFIPWDDDLDIGMPRDDYEKLMKIFKSEASSQFFLQNIDSEPDYWLTFAKVRKNQTLFEEPSVSTMPDHIHKGIFVDIFPIDYVKKNHGPLVHMQFILSKAIAETLYYRAGVYQDLKSLKYASLDRLLNLFSNKSLLHFQKWVVTLQKKSKAKYLADFNSSLYYLNAIFPVTLFLPVKQSAFANREYDIPNDYDSYLRGIYGDYMKLPKEEDRVNHRTLRIIFDTEQEDEEA